jgi:hypothetical protein
MDIAAEDGRMASVPRPFQQVDVLGQAPYAGAGEL